MSNDRAPSVFVLVLAPTCLPESLDLDAAGRPLSISIFPCTILVGGLLLLFQLSNDLVGAVEDTTGGCAARGALRCLRETLDRTRRAEVVLAPSDDRVCVRLAADEAGERDVFVI